ncbi:MAG TPA: hypothetical protein DD670_20730 [Planctomycetaceae bacterium]|nr:hypothetical protein [Planctomycetaceae bacterium]
MKYVVLTLVAALAMTSVSMAALTITVSDPVDLADPLDQLEAYTVNVKGANVFLNVAIDGLVHQMNADFGMLNPSLWTDSLGMFGGAAANPYDTQFLLPSTQAVIAVPFAVPTESNDATNPGGLAAGAFGGVNKYGMGMFNVGAGEWGSASINMETGVDLMQIVLRKGDLVGVTLRGAGDGGQGPLSFSVQVGGVIPEPGTIMLLLTGALCLLGLRRR